MYWGRHDSSCARQGECNRGLQRGGARPRCFVMQLVPGSAAVCHSPETEVVEVSLGGGRGAAVAAATVRSHGATVTAGAAARTACHTESRCAARVSHVGTGSTRRRFSL